MAIYTQELLALIRATPSSNFDAGTTQASYVRGRLGASGRGSSKTTSDRTSLLSKSVDSILGLQSKADIDKANAAAEEAKDTGFKAEIKAYGTASEIAAQNAIIEGVSGDIQKLQAERRLSRVVGAQQAGYSAAGFREAGTAVDVLAASRQQGALQGQLINTQTAITQGGYLEQQAAYKAETGAAQAASDAAASLATSYTSAGSLTRANAANETKALKDYLADQTLTPEEKFTVSSLDADITKPTTFDKTLVEPTSSEPLPGVTSTSPLLKFRGTR